MLTQLFPRNFSRYTLSLVAGSLESFGQWLNEEGYAHDISCGHLFRLKRALERIGAVTSETCFSATELGRMFTFDNAKPRMQAQYRHTQHIFEHFLIARDRWIVEADGELFSALLNRYRNHLVDLRGIAPSTIDNHMATVRSFLAQEISAEDSLVALSKSQVDAFVAATGKRLTRQSLQNEIAHLRAFLSFCHDHGEIRDRIDAIDRPRVVCGELPPRALAWCDVLALLRSIDRSTMMGCRDHAILYLMAHYGLRPSEIVSLQLNAIDWTGKTLRVTQRKTHSELLLPLSPTALQVLQYYLLHGRSRSRSRCSELFLREYSPTCALGSKAINSIYQKHRRASGLSLQASSCYSLRHAFAMRLLNQGVGIKSIGDLLGHRSLQSTCVYLRLQTEVLREVGLPLPEVDQSARRLS